MSTKTYVEKRINEIQLELNELKNSVSLPEGFVAFNPTKEDKCPCDPKDMVLVKYRDGMLSKTPAPASGWRWSDCDSCADIVAYKVIQKHYGPRPMKLAEIPVGVPFCQEGESSCVFMKIAGDKTILIYNKPNIMDCGHSYYLKPDLDYQVVKISIGG